MAKEETCVIEWKCPECGYRMILPCPPESPVTCIRCTDKALMEEMRRVCIEYPVSNIINDNTMFGGVRP